MVSNAITDKVSVGNGSNGLESKVLENVEANGSTFNTLVSQTVTMKIGDIIDNTSDSNTNPGSLPYLYEVIQEITYDVNAVSLGNTSYFKIIYSSGIISTTPEHTTLQLDNSISPASKWFTSLVEMENGELAVQVSGEEMITNVGVYDGDDNTFSQLTNGTLTDLNGNPTKTANVVKRLGVYNDK